MAGADDHLAKLSGMILSLKCDAIQIDYKRMGKDLAILIEPAARVSGVTKSDLTVYGRVAEDSGVPVIIPPASIAEAMQLGTKFFDAYFYFLLEGDNRPAVREGQLSPRPAGEIADELNRRLSWMAIFLMIRGGYPRTATRAGVTDVPKFLQDFFPTTDTPLEVSKALSSFDINKIDPAWIKVLDWGKSGVVLREKLGRSFAGYRLLNMFMFYRPKADASVTELAAYDYIRGIGMKPLDYNVLSCTRSALLVQTLGPWNKNLTNAIRAIFSQQDIDDAVNRKILAVQPAHQSNASNWRNWAGLGYEYLNSPVRMDMAD
jgi:hypothetical protein